MVWNRCALWKVSSRITEKIWLLQRPEAELERHIAEPHLQSCSKIIWTKLVIVTGNPVKAEWTTIEQLKFHLITHCQMNQPPCLIACPSTETLKPDPTFKVRLPSVPFVQSAAIEQLLRETVTQSTRHWSVGPAYRWGIQGLLPQSNSVIPTWISKAQALHMRPPKGVLPPTFFWPHWIWGAFSRAMVTMSFVSQVGQL